MESELGKDVASILVFFMLSGMSPQRAYRAMAVLLALEEESNSNFPAEFRELRKSARRSLKEAKRSYV